MMYGFCYKRGSLSYNRVKSLVNAIDFELPRNWDCSGEMIRKADEVNAFMQNKVAFAHLGVVGIFNVVGIFKTYTPHMATMMLDVTWYCAVSAYHKPIRNVHCVARMGTEYGAPLAVGIGTSLAADRNSGKMKSFLGVLRDLGAFIPENSFEYMPDLAVAVVLARLKALSNKGVPNADNVPSMFIVTSVLN